MPIIVEYRGQAATSDSNRGSANQVLIIDKFFLDDPKFPGVFRVTPEGASLSAEPRPPFVDVVHTFDEAAARVNALIDK